MTVKAGLNDTDIIEIARGCAELLDGKKARESVLLDLRGVNSYLDYFIITTGNSQVHCKSLARDVMQYFNSRGLNEHSRPDLNSGWIVLDYSEIIIHIFTEEMRLYYRLEKLWADAAVIPVSAPAG